MNTAGFEDTVFLLNIRIRMVRDTMRLNPHGELFMERCLDDIMFIDNVLASLAQQITVDIEQDGTSDDADDANGAANGVVDYAADTEWQFSQLLTEFLLESNAFSARATSTERGKVILLREGSNARRKVFEKFSTSSQADLTEPVVSSTELSILFGGT
ncbi:MAG: hypothetical protein FWB78_11050 [Treponema sp.]|nr:hypothetical protein [Treponema sp.]